MRLAQRAERERREQRYFGRDAMVFRARPRVTRDRDRTDQQRNGDEQERTLAERPEYAEEADERECSYACDFAIRPRPFRPLALRADQQTHAEGDGRRQYEILHVTLLPG